MVRHRIIGIAIALALAIGSGSTGAVSTAAAAIALGPHGVVIAPAAIKPGAKCAKQVAGCTHGKFTGNFFGS